MGRGEGIGLGLSFRADLCLELMVVMKGQSSGLLGPNLDPPTTTTMVEYCYGKVLHCLVETRSFKHAVNDVFFNFTRYKEL
ncbi:unnamed protein product [Lactuca virosa]|uniref:Uncharacterized protein n=1 Tax=Lactuca virosa TaxID=75947 RepID=A0AAU9P346_9ASTR|nr:unnamed protein product [Lactuca virosa]